MIKSRTLRRFPRANYWALISCLLVGLSCPVSMVQAQSCNAALEVLSLTSNTGIHAEIRPESPNGCYRLMVTPPASSPNIRMTAYIATTFDPTGIAYGDLIFYLNPHTVQTQYPISGSGTRSILLPVLPENQIYYLQIIASVNGSFVSSETIRYRNVQNQPTGWTPLRGPQPTVVLLVHSPDMPTMGKTSEQTRDEILNLENPYSLNRYLYESSQGQLWLEGDVRGWFETEPGLVSIDDGVEAADPEVDFSKYKRVIVIYPFGYEWAITSDGTPRIFQTDEGAVSLIGTTYSFDIDNGLPDFSLLTQYSPPFPSSILQHEILHTFGLEHPAWLDCGEQPYIINGQGCRVAPISDHSDPLARKAGEVSSIYKHEKLGWLNASQVKEVTQSGIYKIFPASQQSNRTLLLKVPRVECVTPGSDSDSCGGDGRGYYYLDYHRPIRSDIPLFLNSYVGSGYNGPTFRIDGFDGEEQGENASMSLLMDRTPGAYSRALKVGRTFTDPHRGTQFTTLEVTDTYTKVQITFADGVCGDGIINGPETCDDANTVSGDACPNNCLNN